MPRHPPFALRNLTTKIKIAIDSNNNQHKPVIVTSDLRCSRPLCSSQHTIGTTLPQHSRVSFMWPIEEPATPTTRRPRLSRLNPRSSRPGSLVPQDPTTCTSHPAPHQPVPDQPRRTGRTEIGRRADDCTVNVPPMSYRQPHSGCIGAWIPASHEDCTRPDAP
jgi:hypothetical protein